MDDAHDAEPSHHPPASPVPLCAPGSSAASNERYTASLAADGGAAEPDFIDTYRASVTPLYLYVLRRAGGARELAEDVTQETYLRFCAAWRGGTRPDIPLAWLKAVARNLLLDHFRRSLPAPADSSFLDRLATDAPEENSTDAALVQHGLTRLRTRHARLIEARYLDGKDVRAIATDTGLSERAVEGQLRRARLALHRILSRWLEHQGDRR